MELPEMSGYLNPTHRDDEQPDELPMPTLTHDERTQVQHELVALGWSAVTLERMSDAELMMAASMAVRA